MVATEIHCCHFVCHVLESPDEVARLRDAIFGYTTPELKAV